MFLDEFSSPLQLPAELRRVLKARAIPRHFKRIAAKRSKSEPLIQVADLVAGALVRHLAQNDNEAYRAIASKMQQVVEYRAE